MIAKFLLGIRIYQPVNFAINSNKIENQLLQSQMYLGGNHE